MNRLPKSHPKAQWKGAQARVRRDGLPNCRIRAPRQLPVAVAVNRSADAAAATLSQTGQINSQAGLPTDTKSTGVTALPQIAAPISGSTAISDGATSPSLSLTAGGGQANVATVTVTNMASEEAITQPAETMTATVVVNNTVGQQSASDNSPTLSTGSVASIVIGVLALILVLIALLIIWRKTRKPSRYHRYWNGWSQSRLLLPSIDGGSRPMLSPFVPVTLPAAARIATHVSGAGYPRPSGLTQDRSSHEREDSVLLTPFTTPHNSWYGEPQPSPLEASSRTSRSGSISTALVGSLTAAFGNRPRSIDDEEEGLQPWPIEHSEECTHSPRATLPPQGSDIIKLPIRNRSLNLAHLPHGVYPTAADLRSPQEATSSSSLLVDSAAATNGTASPVPPVPSIQSVLDPQSVDHALSRQITPSKNRRMLIAAQLSRTRLPGESTSSLTPIVEHDRDVGRMRVLLPPVYDPRWTLALSEEDETDDGHGDPHGSPEATRHHSAHPHSHPHSFIQPLMRTYRGSDLARFAPPVGYDRQSNYDDQADFLNQFFPVDMTPEEFEAKLSKTL